MFFEFIRPVFTGDTILCEVLIEQYEKQKQQNRIKIASSFSCTNQHHKEVMVGNFTGVILFKD